jgi:hypothetical protein
MPTLNCGFYNKVKYNIFINVEDIEMFLVCDIYTGPGKVGHTL